MSTQTTPIEPVIAPNTLRVGLCQIQTTPDKQFNLAGAKKAINEAVAKGAKLVVLPEIFNSPYDNSAFPLYQEPIPEINTTNVELNEKYADTALTTTILSNLAKELDIYLVGGSIPESSTADVRVDGKSVIYNTSVVFNNTGDIIAKHRKVHLFDIDIPGKVTFKESESLTQGDSITTFTYPSNLLPNKTPEFRDNLVFGLGICYDIRFAEYAMVARQVYNADALIYPGAFTMPTGEAHWELLQKARALDNQLYVMACSPSRAIPSDPIYTCKTTGKSYHYQAWGHSSVISPWGKVLGMADEKPGVIIADLDFVEMDDIRQRVPISKQRRNDLYIVKNTEKL